MKIEVECYAGHRGEEEPRAFPLGATRLPIVGAWELAGLTAGCPRTP